MPIQIPLWMRPQKTPKLDSTRAMPNYLNPYPVPTVYDMMTAGGAAYDPNAVIVRTGDAHAYPRFPSSWLARIRTPVPRMTAFFGGSFMLNAVDPRGSNDDSNGQ